MRFRLTDFFHRSRPLTACGILGILAAAGALWFFSGNRGAAPREHRDESRWARRPVREERRISTGIPAENLRSWIEREPLAAVEWLDGLPEGPAREQALDALAAIWGDRDIAAAAAWARRLPNAAERERAMLAVAAEAVRASPIEALRLAVELPPGTARDETLRRASAEWALADAPGAVEWAREIEDSALRATVLASVATAWSERDPRAAATLAVEELDVGRVQADTVVAIVQRWVQTEPDEAKAWVDQFPEGTLKEAAKASMEAILSASPP